MYKRQALNNAVNKSTGLSPFFITSFRHPIIPLDVLRTRDTRPEAYAADSFLDKHLSVQKQVEQAISTAQENQQKYFNQKHKPVQYNVGDKVLLTTKHIKLPTDMLKKSRKFRNLYVGPFTVTERIGKNAYRLDLQHTNSRIHDVFHVNKLRIFHSRENQQY